MAVLSENALQALKALTHELVQGNYRQLAADGRVGRLTIAELEYAVALYGRRLIDLPDTAFLEAKVYIIADTLSDETGGRMKVDLDLWTVEEGRSDLTLTVTIAEVADQVTIQIEDLHVL